MHSPGLTARAKGVLRVKASSYPAKEREKENAQKICFAEKRYENHDHCWQVSVRLVAPEGDLIVVSFYRHILGWFILPIASVWIRGGGGALEGLIGNELPDEL